MVNLLVVENSALLTDFHSYAAMKFLDPNLQDGVYEWQDGRRIEKKGESLYLEGTTTLAGRYIFLFTSVLQRSFFFFFFFATSLLISYQCCPIR
jgi:hypothetical protein